MHGCVRSPNAGFLEPALGAIQDLQRKLLIFVSQNPAVTVLRLNHEDAEPGEQYVIDLSCPIAGENDEVVETVCRYRYRA